MYLRLTMSKTRGYTDDDFGAPDQGPGATSILYNGIFCSRLAEHFRFAMET